jgi:hypothetical protein
MIAFKLTEVKEILSKTPKTLQELLCAVSEARLDFNEGPETFSTYDVMRHLIYGERVDWLPRARIILSDSELRSFESFDRRGGQNVAVKASISELLAKFAELRSNNLHELDAYEISDKTLQKTGIHPEFGEVTLQQLLVSWVAHDLTHIRQIVRLIAEGYRADVGPWVKYMGIYGDV